MGWVASPMLQYCTVLCNTVLVGGGKWVKYGCLACTTGNSAKSPVAKNTPQLAGRLLEAMRLLTAPEPAAQADAQVLIYLFYTERVATRRSHRPAPRAHLQAMQLQPVAGRPPSEACAGIVSLGG